MQTKMAKFGKLVLTRNTGDLTYYCVLCVLFHFHIVSSMYALLFSCTDIGEPEFDPKTYFILKLQSPTIWELPKLCSSNSHSLLFVFSLLQLLTIFILPFNNCRCSQFLRLLSILSDQICCMLNTDSCFHPMCTILYMDFLTVGKGSPL